MYEIKINLAYTRCRDLFPIKCFLKAELIRPCAIAAEGPTEAAGGNKSREANQWKLEFFVLLWMQKKTFIIHSVVQCVSVDTIKFDM